MAKINNNKHELSLKKNPITKHIPLNIKTSAEAIPQNFGKNESPMALKILPNVSSMFNPPAKYFTPLAIKNAPSINRRNNFPKFSLSKKFVKIAK